MKDKKTNQQKLNRIHQDIKPDYYDQGISKNIFQWYWHTKRFKIIEKIINDYRGKTLDIGCHSGNITKLMADITGSETHGLDISTQAIKYAQEKYPGLYFQVAQVQKDLPYASNTFDLVTCFDVLEHIPDVKKLIQEIKRILKGKGYLIIGLPVENILWKIVWFFWTRSKGRVWQETHIHKFTDQHLTDLLEKNNFAKIQEKKIHLGMWRIIKYKYCEL